MNKNYDIADGFNKIAKRYDVGNDAMTFGLHRLWRNNLCQKAKELTEVKGNLLDLATGTGDVLLKIHSLSPQIKLWGADISDAMLAEAKKKLSQLKNVTLVNVDGRKKLPFEDNFFHTITISWGIRNIVPWEDALKECHRILRPGGTLLILESGMPEAPLWRAVYSQYSKILPTIGGVLSGYRPSYEYYVKSVEAFPSGHAFVSVLHGQKFQRATYRALMGGIVYLYTAFKA